MKHTYNEARLQYHSMKLTYEELLKQKSAIKNFADSFDYQNIIFIGCGSSYCLCKSAALLFSVESPKKAFAFAAGDLLLNYQNYENILDKSLIVTFSRSGETSEVLKIASILKENYDCKIFSTLCSENSSIQTQSDFTILIPWAFDKSVCQTQSVSNLYVVILMLSWIINDNPVKLKQLKKMLDVGNDFIQLNENSFQEIGQLDLDDIVLLADGINYGIAQEAVLALCEISQVRAVHYNILDVRHGPTVLMNEKTLIIILFDHKTPYNQDLINDLLKTTNKIVVLAGEQDDYSNTFKSITIPSELSSEIYGLPLVNTVQLISYFKAIDKGIDPDNPNGLVPWIKL